MAITGAMRAACWASIKSFIQNRSDGIAQLSGLGHGRGVPGSGAGGAYQGLALRPGIGFH